MRELKYHDVGGPGSAHPELEEIAAYLDGRLSAAERRGITAHLSVCTECLELFTETAHALEETSAGTAGGKVVPFDRPLRSPHRWLPAVAAAAALLAFGFAGYRLFLARPSMVVADLVEPLGESRAVAEAVWTGRVLRGGGEEEDSTAFRALSFLAGAHLVGFQAGVEARDPEAAGAAAQRVANLLEQGDFLENEAKRFRAAQFDLFERKVPTSRYARLVEKNSGPIEESFLEIPFDLGKWTHAGYIAARTGSREWFERRKNRRFLSYLLRQGEKEIEPEARKGLERIGQVWDRGELRPAELAALAGQFEAILQRYQALSEQDELFFGE